MSESAPSKLASATVRLVRRSSRCKITSSCHPSSTSYTRSSLSREQFSAITRITASETCSSSFSTVIAVHWKKKQRASSSLTSLMSPKSQQSLDSRSLRSDEGSICHRG
uniref:(northern house mosquito) hypothetical protein n=1 Tax=Culex pipiens TaxID=7175 RepID=A0A8D8KCH7_CULPI